jgi:sodium/hydrogen antiporter
VGRSTPADAALGVPVVTNSMVPGRIRRLITVKSGLDDEIVATVVVLAPPGRHRSSSP